MLNLSLQAVDQGLRHLADTTALLGTYLGNAGWAMRAWARDNPDVVTRYLAAYVD